MKKKIDKKRRPLISALEPRILFDGAAVATAVDVLDNTSYDSSSQDNPSTNSDTNTNNDVTIDITDIATAQAVEQERKEIAFVDTTVENYQTLVNGVSEGVEVELIDSLDDITSILQNKTNLDAIHILSHGSTGEITIGEDTLNSDSLDVYNEVLQTIKNAMSQNGDIMLYGCNVASNGDGQEFIDTLANITEADIAASNDITGSASLNGDWDLEVNSGVIDTQEIVVDSYTEKLGTSATYTFTTTTSYLNQPGAIITASNVQLTDGGTLTLIANDVDFHGTDTSVNTELAQVSISYDNGSTWHYLTWDAYYIDTNSANFVFSRNEATNAYSWQLQETNGDSYLRGENNKFSKMVFTIPDFTGKDGFNSGDSLEIKIEMVGKYYTETNVVKTTLDVFSNTAPTSTNTSVTFNEDTSYTFSLSDFPFTDADTIADGDQLTSVLVTSLPAKGSLQYYNGSSWSSVLNNQSISRADISAGYLKFTPDTNENGTNYTSFNFKVNDGYVNSSSSYSFTLNVNPVDDAPVLNVGSLNTFDSNVSSVDIAPNLTLTDVDTGDTLTTAKIQIDNFVSGDTLSFTNDGSTMGSISSSYNSSTGILTLSGTATTAQYEAALKNVKYSRSNTDNTDRNFSFTVGSAIPYSGNGHYYEVAYFSSGKTWSAAKTFAESQTLYGMQGYLATITSAEENAFILSKLPADGWIGASDAAVEGQWKWVSGPESGQTVSYSNWNSGEPNNSGGNEDAAEFYATGVNPGKWNDLPSNSTTLQYAIIEYGGMAGDASPVISGSGTMDINEAPVFSNVDNSNSNTNNAQSGELVSTYVITDTPSITPLSLDVGQSVSIDLYYGNASNTSYLDLMYNFYNSQTNMSANKITTALDGSSLNSQLLIVFQPPNAFSANELATFSSYLDNGGRIFFVGEHNGYKPTENANISAGITSLGGNITVLGGTYNENTHTNSDNVNTNLNNSPLMAGVGTFQTAAYAQLQMDSVISKAVIVDDSNRIVMADQALSKGRVTVLADQNWLDSGRLDVSNNDVFLRNLAIDSLQAVTLVDNGGNPNAEFQTSTNIQETDSPLTSDGTMTVSDVDTSNEVSVSVSSITTYINDTETDISSNISSSDLLKMLSISSTNSAVTDNSNIPGISIVDTSSTSGGLTWSFDSNSDNLNEAFNFLADGQTLKLSYTITADDGHYGTDTQTIDILIDGTNDAPVVTTPTTINITDSSGASIIGDISSTLSATDVDSTNLTYSIDNGSSLVQTLVGTYGTLTLNSSTGAYTYTPNLASINALNSDDTDSFTINASDGTNSSQTTLTVNITANSESSITYTEQDSATLILTDTTINTNESYGGGYIEFDLSNSTSSETLAIQKVSTADTTNGAISVIGNAVYLGDGTTSKVIGQIDGTYNGENGSKLRINFSVDFTNGDFQSSTVGSVVTTEGTTTTIEGWTIVNDRAILGTTEIAGLLTPNDSTTDTYPTRNFTDDSGSATNFDYNVYVANESGDKSIQMYSRGTSDSYGVIRGPYVYSTGNVSLEVGDTVSFDWKAQGGSDAYDVFGYIVNVNDASDYQIILDDTAASASVSTNWATETVTVNSAGEYKFVFLSGTFDATGGRALGAQLFIDDVKVTQANPPSSIGSNVLENIAKKVTYENSSDLSAVNGTINKTVTVTTASGDDTPIVHSSTKALIIQETNDAPTGTDKTITINEDTSSVLTSSDFGFNDVDTGDTLVSIKITSLETAGTLEYYNGSSWVNVTLNQVITKADVDAGYLRFSPSTNGNGTGYDSFDFKVNDGTVDSDSANTITFDVTPVDDLPTAIQLTAVLSKNSEQLFGAMQPNYTDPDSGDQAYQALITSLPTNGKIYYDTNNNVNNRNWVEITDVNDSRLKFLMTQLDYYKYTPDTDFTGDDIFTWKIMTTGNTNDSTGWSNEANAKFIVLDSGDHTAPTLNVYDSSNNNINGGTITIDEDTAANGIKLIFSDDYTPTEFMIGNISSSDTSIVDPATNVTMVKSTTTTTNDTVTFTITPKANMNGAVTLTFSANDGNKVSTQTVTLNITPINDAPTSTDKTITINEDTATLLTSSDFEFSDVDTGDTLSSIKITSLETDGSLEYFDGSSWLDVTLNQVITKADVDTGYLRFTPSLNENGTNYASFGYKVSDGIVFSSTANTITYNVTAVNDAPVVTTPTTINITDSSGASIIGNISSTLSATDVDNTSLTYSIDSGSGLVQNLGGTYGTLNINISTGEYTYIPNLASINALNANATETFTLNVSDGETAKDVQTTLTINVTATADTAATYTEQDSATDILTDTNIDTNESYGGGFIEFNVSDATSTETLGIQKVSTADTTDGIVSIVGNVVYLGDGTTAKVIGQIDSTYNGENGNKLRINFSIDFANGNFENASAGTISTTVGQTIQIDGWTIVNDRVTLGSDVHYDYVQHQTIENTIAGLATPEDTTYPSRNLSKTRTDTSAISNDPYVNGMQDYGNLDRTGYYTYVASGSVSNGGTGNSIQMKSSLNSEAGYEVIRGPYIYSTGSVNLEVGDDVSFYWKAQGGSDAYDVFGYIINVNDPSDYQIILNDTGASARSQTSWAQENITVDSAGEYKFVFISGTFDATGGEALGAQLYIDDVKVTQANPTSGLSSDILEKVAQKITYENSSDLTATNGITNKTVTVTTSSGDSTPITHSWTKALNIQEVNDSVSLNSPATIYYTDTDGVDTFNSSTGTLSASDADSNTVFTYGIDGSINNGNGTLTKAGNYGILTINTSTGEYTYTPDSNAINALSSDTTDTFTMTVNDGSGSSDSKTLTIDIESVNDAPLLGGTATNATFVENGSAVQIDPSITISDPEASSYDGGYIQIDYVSGSENSDDLTILNLGGISFDGTNITYAGNLIGTVDSIINGQDGQSLRINLNTNAYSQQVQALAQAIAFSNPTDDLSGTSRVVQFRVNDGGDGSSTTPRYSTKDVTVDIVPINDLPQITLSDSTYVVEKVIGVNDNGTLSLTGISFSDLDGDTLSVTLETTTYGTITVDSSISGGLTSSSISGNGTRTVTLTGTIEQINTTLAASNALTYTAGSGNDYITPGADYLKITAIDPEAGQTISTKLVIVLPAIPNANSDNIVSKEDQAIGVDVETLVSDINDNAGTYVFGTGTPDIADTNGTTTTAGSITAFDSSKIIYADYDINGDDVIDSADTSTAIGYQLEHGQLILNNDQALGSDFAQFTYVPEDNWSGVESFVYQYTSGDNKISKIAEVKIFVVPVNDAPTVSVNTTVTINEDTPYTFDSNNPITFADIDNTGTERFQLELSANNGKVKLSSLTNLNVISGYDNTSKVILQGTLSNIQDAINNLIYTPNKDYNGSDTLTVTINDLGNTGEGGNLSETKTINFSIAPVNDAPTINVSNTNVSFDLDTDNSISTNGGIQFIDVDTPDRPTVTSSTKSITALAQDGVSSLTLTSQQYNLINDAFSLAVSSGNLNTGTASWDYTIAKSDLAFLGEGEKVTAVYTITVTDGDGVTDTQDITITITGTNDAPQIQIVDVSGTIIEGNDSLNETGQVTFTDVDLTDRPTGTELTSQVSALRKDGTTSFTLTSSQQQAIEDAFSITNVLENSNDGTITWDYTISESAIDFLGQGEKVTAVFTITVTDDEGATDTQNVTIIINGTNDAPTVDSETNIDEELNFGDTINKDLSTLFSDADLNNVFTYSINDLPIGMSFDPNTGIISGDALEPGVFTIIVEATDSEGAKVQRTFEMLVIAPPQPEAQPDDTGTKKGGDDTPADSTAKNKEIKKDNGVEESDTDSMLNQNPKDNGGDGQNKTPEITKTELTTITTGGNNNANDKIIEADINLNVGNDGQVNFGEKTKEAYETVGLRIEKIEFKQDNLEIKIIDARVGQKYIATLADGSDLPDSLTFDSNTGMVKGSLPEGVDELEISIKALSTDGTTRVLTIKIDAKELKAAQPQASFETLSEQIMAENDKMNNYGDYIVNLFSSSNTVA